MRKRVYAVLLAMAVTFGMTACGNAIPDMSEDQMRAVGEYAAITLMKYDIDHRSRLVDLELVAQEEARRKEEAEAEALRREQEAEASQEGTGMRPTEDTPVIGADGVPESGPASLEEALSLPEGVTVTYREMVVCDSYPEGGGDYFAMTATEGNRFLVLKFDLYNGSGQEQTIDMLSRGAVFKVTVNGNFTRRALTTMLPDDFTVYDGSIAAGSNTELVIVVEAEGSVADSVSSLSLNVNNDSKTYSVQYL